MFEFADPTTATGAVTLAELRALSDAVAVVVARLEPDDIPLSQAAECWRQLDLASKLAKGGTTLLARKVDQSGAWKRAGCKSVDEFLAREGGIGLGDARRQRKASEQLRDLPDTTEALREGRLSADQAEAISEAATVNPGAEQGLLDSAAQKGLKDLQADCGRARQQGDRNPGETERRIRRERRFNVFGRADGSAGMFGNGPVDEAAVLSAALQPIVDRMYRERRGTADQAERQSYLWDALIEIAHSQVDGSLESKKQKSRPNYLAILHVDLAALIRGYVEGDEVCEIPGLGPVPISRLREMLPESSIRLVITKGIAVQNVTNLGRGPNAAQKIALMWSQPQCTNIACTHTWTQDDHRDPFARVQCTDLSNIDPLCPHDHDLKTYQGWSLVDGTGRRDFVAPTNPRHPNHTRTRAGPEPPDD